MTPLSRAPRGVRGTDWRETVRVELFAPFLALAFLAKNPTSDPDYLAYLQFYGHTTIASLGTASDIEWGFRALCALGNAINLSYVAFGYLVVLGAITIKLHVLRQFLGPAAAYAVIAYVSSLFILHELVQIRLSIALAFFALGMQRWAEDRRWWAVVCAAVAVSMHISIAALVGAVVFVRFPKILLAGTLIIIGFSLVPDKTRADFIASIIRLVGTETPLIRKIAEYAFQLGQLPSTQSLITAQTVVVAGTVVGVVLSSVLSPTSFVAQPMAKPVSLLLVIGLISQVALASSPVLSGRLLELFSAVMPIGQAITLHAVARKWPFIVPVLLAGFLMLNLWAFGHVLLPLREMLWP
jgi:hypothetical protein